MKTLMLKTFIIVIFHVFKVVENGSGRHTDWWWKLQRNVFLYPHLSSKKPKVFLTTASPKRPSAASPAINCKAPGSSIGALGIATGGTAHGRSWSRKAGLVVWWLVGLGKKSQTEHLFLSFLRLVAAEEQVTGLKEYFRFWIHVVSESRFFIIMPWCPEAVSQILWYHFYSSPTLHFRPAMWALTICAAVLAAVSLLRCCRVHLFRPKKAAGSWQSTCFQQAWAWPLSSATSIWIWIF